MSEVTGFIVALIAAEKVGVFEKYMKMKKRDITPPTSKAGIRPICGPGKKAVHFENPDHWLCVPTFK